MQAQKSIWLLWMILNDSKWFQMILNETKWIRWIANMHQKTLFILNENGNNFQSLWS